MDFFSTNSFIIIGIIIGISIIIAPIIQNIVLIRFLIASYISFGLIIIMPDYFIFNIFAKIIYFFIFVIILTIIKSSNFFDVIPWNVRRFSFASIALSIFVLLFIMAIICKFVPFINLNIFLTKDMYNFFNVYIFYIAIMPLIFLLIVSNKLRA